MHELSLLTGLIRKITAIAQSEGSPKVTKAKVKLGALCHLSPRSLREHFEHAAQGTIAEGAFLDIEILSDTTDPLAQNLMLDSIEVETNDNVRTP